MDAAAQGSSLCRYFKLGIIGWVGVHFVATGRFGSYPCGNFSDTSSLKLLKTKGSIGHAFTVCIHTENQNQMSFYPFVLHEISVLIELILGHLRYLLADVPPQPNSPPDYVFVPDSAGKLPQIQKQSRKGLLRINELVK